MFSFFRDNLLFFRQAAGWGVDHLYPIRDWDDLRFGVSFGRSSLFSVYLYSQGLALRRLNLKPGAFFRVPRFEEQWIPILVFWEPWNCQKLCASSAWVYGLCIPPDRIHVCLFSRWAWQSSQPGISLLMSFSNYIGDCALFFQVLQEDFIFLAKRKTGKSPSEGHIFFQGTKWECCLQPYVKGADLPSHSPWVTGLISYFPHVELQNLGPRLQRSAEVIRANTSSSSPPISFPSPWPQTLIISHTVTPAQSDII